MHQQTVYINRDLPLGLKRKITWAKIELHASTETYINASKETYIYASKETRINASKKTTVCIYRDIQLGLKKNFT